MDDYQTWCRLCGALSSLSEINSEILPLLEDTFELKSHSFRVCFECHNNLIQFVTLLVKSKELQKMFQGLDEEEKSDLDIVRLNAYRTHFQLTDLIPEPPQKFEVIIEKIEGESTAEEIKTEIIEEIIEEPMVIEEIVEEFIEEPSEGENEELLEEEMIEDFDDNEEEKLVPEYEGLFVFSCHLCGSDPFPRFRALQSHCKKLHDCLPQVRCCSEECGKSLSTWRRLVIHKEKHFPSHDVMKCEICHRVFSTAAGFEKHKKSHLRTFYCTYCAKGFKEPKTLRFHERTHEKEVDERRNFECSHCGQKFVTKQACQNHIGQKHEKIVSFYCQFASCGKGFFTQKALCEHRRVHEERKYACEMCNFMGKTKAALIAHMDVHQTKLNFKCEICEVGFPSTRRLKNHMIVHTDIAPHVCTQCNAKFKRKKDLNNHMNTHSKIKGYACNFCPRTFTNGSNCRKHKVRDHPKELKEYEAIHGSGRKLKCYL